MTQNKVSATLSAEDRRAIMDAIATIKQAMPFLVHLTADDRKSAPKVGDRAQGFIRNCLDAAQQHTECLPRSFDVEEMEKDVRLMEDLYPVLMMLKELLSLVDDTYFAAKIEAYMASLRVYDSVKSHIDEPGMKIVADKLQSQFARRNQKDSAGANPEPVPTIVS